MFGVSGIWYALAPNKKPGGLARFPPKSHEEVFRMLSGAGKRGDEHLSATSAILTHYIILGSSWHLMYSLEHLLL